MNSVAGIVAPACPRRGYAGASAASVPVLSPMKGTRTSMRSRVYNDLTSFG